MEGKDANHEGEKEPRDNDDKGGHIRHDLEKHARVEVERVYTPRIVERINVHARNAQCG